MVQRGRKSAAQLGVIAAGIDAVQRPDPPAELTAEQAEVWRDTVAVMRAAWFGRETWPLLIQYCRHVVHARHIAKLLQATDLESDIGKFRKLWGIEARESALIAMLATRMRLTHQSSADPKKKHDPSAALPKPWEMASVELTDDQLDDAVIAPLPLPYETRAPLLFREHPSGTDQGCYDLPGRVAKREAVPPSTHDRGLAISRERDGAAL